MVQKKFSSLTLKEDPTFQKRFWRVERIGWTASLIFLLMVLLGFTGDGPLNRTMAKQDNLKVIYEPFARQQTLTKVHLEIENTHDDLVRVSLQRQFLNDYQIEQIVPQPVDVISGDDSYIYFFQTQSQNTYVIYYLKPQTIGSKKGMFSLHGGNTVSFDQFVYP